MNDAANPWSFADESFSRELPVRWVDGTGLADALAFMHRALRGTDVVTREPWWGYLYFSRPLSSEQSDRIESGERMVIPGDDGVPIELQMSRRIAGSSDHHCYLVVSS